ncbi:antitoxin Xre-like helix-turn-helix domain-containing protein [Ferrovibrio sp.]|uniref:antitoxin Xre-like helix-turn-helix domain-containing protein n=1 Tax=Ferrovibrio sp. TaxID=1917215 RepID=UPI0039C87E27
MSVTAPDAGQILSKAVVRAAENLGLSQAMIAEVIGVSPSTASRLFSGKLVLDPRNRNVWELSVLFIRLYRSLDALIGHADQARIWLNGPKSPFENWLNGICGAIRDFPWRRGSWLRRRRCVAHSRAPAGASG